MRAQFIEDMICPFGLYKALLMFIHYDRIRIDQAEILSKIGIFGSTISDLYMYGLVKQLDADYHMITYEISLKGLWFMYHMENCSHQYLYTFNTKTFYNLKDLRQEYFEIAKSVKSK